MAIACYCFSSALQTRRQELFHMDFPDLVNKGKGAKGEERKCIHKLGEETEIEESKAIIVFLDEFEWKNNYETQNNSWTSNKYKS